MELIVNHLDHMLFYQSLWNNNKIPLVYLYWKYIIYILLFKHIIKLGKLSFIDLAGSERGADVKDSNK